LENHFLKFARFEPEFFIIIVVIRPY